MGTRGAELREGGPYVVDGSVRSRQIHCGHVETDSAHRVVAAEAASPQKFGGSLESLSFCVGDALQGETDRLRSRMRQLLHRIETQLRTILRELTLETDPLPGNRPAVLARVLMTLVEGQIVQFVRSDFKHSPTADWEASWLVIREGVFGDQD